MKCIPMASQDGLNTDWICVSVGNINERGATMIETPQVWIGCLTCYSEGWLIGAWYDAIIASDVTSEDLHDGPTTHEELWVMDHEHFHGLLQGECSPAEATRIASLFALIDSDDEADAFGAYLKYHGEGANADCLGEFREMYEGKFESRADFAEQFADDLGLLSSDPWPYNHIDWEGAARDLFYSGDYWDVRASDGGVYVFRSV